MPMLTSAFYPVEPSPQLSPDDAAVPPCLSRSSSPQPMPETICQKSTLPSSLPEELWTQILLEVLPDSLVPACCVSRRFCNILQPIIFKSIVLDMDKCWSNRKDLALFRVCFRSPHLFSLIRHFEFKRNILRTVPSVDLTIEETKFSVQVLRQTVASRSITEAETLKRVRQLYYSCSCCEYPCTHASTSSTFLIDAARLELFNY